MKLRIKKFRFSKGSSADSGITVRSSLFTKEDSPNASYSEVDLHIFITQQPNTMFRSRKKTVANKSEAMDSPITGDGPANSPDSPSPAAEVTSNAANTKMGRKIEVNNRAFKVKRQDVRDPDTGLVVHSTAEIVLKDQQLINMVNSFGVQMNYPERHGMRQNKPTVYLSSLLAALSLFKKEEPTGDFLKLVEWLDGEMVRFKAKADKLISEGKISFDSLWYLFPKNSKAWGRVIDEHVVGGQVQKVAYNKGMFGAIFTVTLNCIKSNGKNFFRVNKDFNIPEFALFEKIEDLNTQPISSDILVRLEDRGRRFIQIAIGHHYKKYEGYMFFRRVHGAKLFKADGRVMCDVSTFQRMLPEYAEFKNTSVQTQYDQFGNPMRQDDAVDGVEKSVPDSELYRCWPTVAGFSFAAKSWGEILVANISDIVFDVEAYDRLVLAPDRKSLIKALVDQQQSKNREVFRDIISGKGGGRIFLLHGPPGVGKTLTAEAIAERIKDPLYSITIGELGITPKDLEATLAEILEVASIWNAVILMDEADIFLEQRSDSDILRNAMVGVFLRLLEYHQGVLFLTTNRVKCFDEAFHSRITIVLKYEPLDHEARRQVWLNLLGSIGGDGYEELSRQLAKHEMNGRQIRSAIQLAHALAQEEKSDIKLEHVETTIRIATQFEK
ncbi:hypothetical protein PROFUN_01159 [Planoprotostelium fungivorum]|uniref:AAA+ ATPase domain-containing protein n=1 Tax=Planoprotostelium fungivorum TaxID=1890364 RepID=A0A2P6NCK2_9EUKA|nr:hypothetical protein PROFUN_01159 [Planoprotostelium fungivorum]